MKIFYGLIALIWAVNFIALFFGYEPDRLVVGCAFLVTTVYLIDATIDEIEGGR